MCTKPELHNVQYRNLCLAELYLLGSFDYLTCRQMPTYTETTLFLVGDEGLEKET